MERVNGRLKDEFGGRYLRVRGPGKVWCHLMFGILALTVEQLMPLTSEELGRHPEQNAGLPAVGQGEGKLVPAHGDRLRSGPQGRAFPLESVLAVG